MKDLRTVKTVENSTAVDILAHLCTVQNLNSNVKNCFGAL
jgi:hypothetical protein